MFSCDTAVLALPILLVTLCFPANSGIAVHVRNEGWDEATIRSKLLRENAQYDWICRNPSRKYNNNNNNKNNKQNNTTIFQGISGRRGTKRPNLRFFLGVFSNNLLVSNCLACWSGPTMARAALGGNQQALQLVRTILIYTYIYTHQIFYIYIHTYIHTRMCVYIHLQVIINRRNKRCHVNI